MTISRIMIAGTNSGVGKTTITLGVMAALTRKGYLVQPFKVGPDYIDPSYHTRVTGQQSINLDNFLTSPTIIEENFNSYGAGKDITIIEGVMGLFDGYEGNSNRGSSAEIAALLECPVVLVIDAQSMARSAAAIASGFINFDPTLNIVGLIINNIGSTRHQRLLESAFADLPVPVIGYLMRNSQLKLTERHLGLVPVSEGENFVHGDIFAEQVEAQIDLDKLIELAEGAPNIALKNMSKNINVPQAQVRIAVAKDAAFNFYYWDGLAYLKELGAELVWFSPLEDQELPQNIGGIIIGGGFPELFLAQLASNLALHEQIRLAYVQEMPIYAECGGYLYLSKGINSFEGEYFSMVNIVPCIGSMTKKLTGMGYRKGTLARSSVFGVTDAAVLGHEFHYSTLVDVPKDFPWAFRLYNSRQEKWVLEGFASKNLLASYLHLHWRGTKNLAENFVQQCVKFLKKEAK